MHDLKKNHNKALVIGSGIAGIASAIRLAVKGYEVTVYEKNDYPGGKLSWFSKDNFSFDAGPSLFTEPQLIEELFLLANEPIAPYFNYTRVDICCNYFFENGKKLPAPSGEEAFSREMEKCIGEPRENILRYLKNSASAYQNIGILFLEHSLHRTGSLMPAAVLKAVKNTKFSYLFRTLNDHNEAAFITPEAVQIFNRFATYNGSDPFKAPAMLSLIAHLELNKGVFYPYGGMISITNALVKLAEKKGVQFRFNSLVEKIIHNQGKVTGIAVNGEVAYAPIVVSNSDVYFTYKNLLNDAARAEKLLTRERSSSALVYYWGMGKTFPELGLHNIFFSKDYKSEFDKLFNKRQLFDDPTVYINITSKMEAGQAPEGKENWFVMVNAPVNIGQDWKEAEIRLKKNVLAKLERILKISIEPHIETETILDPLLIEKRTMSYRGSIYGTSSNSNMAAFVRHPNFSRKIKGLYFVGGSVHPGGGIPLCLNSAKIMGSMVEKDEPALKAKAK